MADQPISGLATYPASPTSATGTSADEIEFLDVNDTSMAATGTNKRVNMADFFSTFITAGANITVTKQTSGGGVSIAGSAGGVTSVSFTGDGTIFTATACTAITTSGTLTPGTGGAGLIAQTQNTFLAGPVSGANAAPTFRALAASDMPAGTGTGTVTSVSWTGDGTIFTASADTAVTTSGTLAPASLISQTKNTFLAGPTTGSNAAPTFRAIDNADLPVGVMAYAPTGVKTGAYNAVVGDLIPVDTTSGNVTITLPTAPANRSRIAAKMVVQGGTNTVTIQAGGSDVFNAALGTTTKTLTIASQAIQVEYAATPAIWYVIADDLPLSGLDSRYFQAATTQSANTILAGPATGSAVAPAFRVLGIADVPAGSVYYQLYGGL